MFSLSLGQVEGALAAMHDVADEHRFAFQGRLKHLQKNGFPSGTNTGKGRRAAYTFEGCCQLVAAFELMQFGFLPAQAILFLAKNWKFGRVVIAAAYKEILWWNAPEDHRFGLSWLWIVRPQLLADLTASNLEERFESDLEAIRLKDFERTLWSDHRDAEAGLILTSGRDYRLAYVNVTWALREFLRCLQAVDEDMPADVFLPEVNEWQHDVDDVAQLVKDFGEDGFTVFRSAENPLVGWRP